MAGRNAEVQSGLTDLRVDCREAGVVSHRWDIVFFDLCWQKDVKLKQQLSFKRKTSHSRAERASFLYVTGAYCIVHTYSSPKNDNNYSLSCHSKSVKPLFIFRTKIKIFLMKFKTFLTIFKAQKGSKDIAKIVHQ